MVMINGLDDPVFNEPFSTQPPLQTTSKLKDSKPNKREVSLSPTSLAKNFSFFGRGFPIWERVFLFQKLTAPGIYVVQTHVQPNR